MAISYVGASAVGSNTAGSMPAYEIGDLLIAFSYRENSGAAPTVPAGVGWTTIPVLATANGNSHRCAYKIATTTSETIGTFTNGQQTFVQVYRGADPTTPIGDDQPNSSQNTSPRYLGLTLDVTDGTSWIVAFSGHRRTEGALETTFDSFSNRVAAKSGTLRQVAGFDSNSGRSSFTTQTVSIGGVSGGWRTQTIEIIAAVDSGSVGSSDGSATASVIGAAQATASASSVGEATASAVGDFTSGSSETATATADGQATVSGIGASQAQSTASSVAEATVSGIAISLASAVGTSTGEATAIAESEYLFASIGISAGEAVVAAFGLSQSAAIGSAAGTSTASGFAFSDAPLGDYMIYRRRRR